MSSITIFSIPMSARPTSRRKKKNTSSVQRSRRRARLRAHAYSCWTSMVTSAPRQSSICEEISVVVQVARPEDEVLLRLENRGGMVHTYGLAASQLRRLKSAGIRLTASVDEVAASGGYMMACVAERIIAAPFAIIGSIGVVGQLPNFNRFLKEHNVDFELHTAGQYKRTLTLFGENTDAARDKFQEELEDTHKLFKSFVTENRPQLEIEMVATGEHWYGTRALERNLIDIIQTSDDYLLAASKDRDIFEVHYKRRRPLQERLASGIRAVVKGVSDERWQDQMLP